MKKLFKTLSWNEIESSHRLMTFIICVLGIFNFFWGEKVPAGGGFGWDGLKYAEMVRHLHTMVSEGQLNTYYAQRILPSAIVRILLQISHTSISDIAIIRCFELYNLILLLGACYIWKLIADNKSLSLSGRWIGFSGIFINYECSKQAFYYPVLTDVTALAIALLLLMFYLEKKPFALFFTTLIGAFVWPATSICGAFLLLFLHAISPASTISLINATDEHSNRHRYVIAIIGLVIFAVIVTTYWMLTGGDPDTRHACQLPKILTDRMIPSVVPCSYENLLSGAPSLFVMMTALTILLCSRSFLTSTLSYLKRVPLNLIILSVAVVLIPMVIVRLLANSAIANPTSIQYLLEYILLPASGKVFLAFVTLVVFWGPLVILLMLHWSAFSKEARKLGPGVVAVIALSLPLGLATEPRFITIAWPFCVLTLALVLETVQKKTFFKFAFILLTIIYAQFWMKLNLAPWTPPDYAGLLDFPKQIFFMHYGLWMSWISYAIQLPVVIFSVLILYKLLGRKKII